MAIRRIDVTSYRTEFGRNSAEHSQWVKAINDTIRQLLPDANALSLEFFNMGGAVNKFEAGVPNKRIIVYNNVKLPDTIDLDDERFTKIETKSGVSYFDSKYEELNIMFDLMGQKYSDAKEEFEELMSKVNELVFKERLKEFSWIYAPSKDKIMNSLEEMTRRAYQEELQEYQNQLANHEARARDLIETLKRAYDMQRELRAKIELAKEVSVDVSERLVKDLDLIAQLPNIKDIHITDDKFVIYTDTIYAYDSQDNNRFLIGEMKIKIRMNNSEVTFYNLTNPRRGYWTDNDPHPHVNGGNGVACLGNVAPTIAELSSRNELYALVLTCIDFLENANVDDPAGRKIYNWDMVDEEGNIIQEGGSHLRTCYNCEEDFDEEDMVYAYHHCEDGELSEGGLVCEGCRDDYYYYSEVHDEYLHENVYEEA